MSQDENRLIEVDVLIVGGGISGSTLGYRLQKQGLKTVIVDKKTFPRDKLCGGLLTQKSVDLIAKIYKDNDFPIECKTNCVDLYLIDNLLSSVETNNTFYSVNRIDFDFWLINKYLLSGGNVITGKPQKKNDDNTVELTNGTTIRYKILVGADGSNSWVRKYIDPSYQVDAVCMETYTESKSLKSNTISIFFSAVPTGYGWIIPKKDFLCIGIGGKIKNNTDIKKKFRNYCQQLRIDEQAQAKGALLPFGHYVKNPVKDNILLVGDAAGLVDPITGEGIYFALLSSQYASDAITKSLKNSGKLSSYNDDLQSIFKVIDDAKIFNKTWFNPICKNLFLKLIKGKKNIVRFYCDNILSHYNILYTEFFKKYYKVRRQRKLKEKSKRKNNLNENNTKQT
jgi:geranylgeranyl reductase family protein